MMIGEWLVVWEENADGDSFFAGVVVFRANRDCLRTGAQYKTYTHLYAV
jgi:hypothetical protein